VGLIMGCVGQQPQPDFWRQVQLDSNRKSSFTADIDVLLLFT